MTCHRRVSRIVQIHPTRRCNLTCQHCYSESGPGIRGELSLELLLDLVRDAAAERYDYLAISGGEPLMWRGLMPLLAAGRSAGMTVTLTTNGTLVTSEVARRLADATSYVAVSVDGAPGSHDRIRGEGSFARMQRGVSLLRSAGVKVGVIWTLTQSNAHELADVYAFGREIEAEFVQVHPLESVGYAAQNLRAEVPDMDELLVAGLFASDLRDESPGTVPIYLDAAASTDLADRVMPSPDRDAPLSALVDPLVVRPDGLVVPGNYALPESWALGRVTEAPLSTLAQQWKEQRLSAWRDLVTDTLSDLPREPCFVNFGARLLLSAQRSSAVARVRRG